MKKIIILLIAILPVLTYGQKNISGIVSDNTGPLPGVSVQVKGTATGAQTDFDGVYAFDSLDSGATLIFSYIGYKTKEVVIGDKSEYNVTLVEDIEELDKVVVVGYGKKSKEDLTGSLVSVKTSDIVKTATTNFDQALEGRASGVTVTSSDGAPGESLNIVIRGGNSITGDNSPLYVVDGVALDNFDPASLSSKDIEDLVVLKDTSATAIYGSRGANGVILITTKGGSGKGLDGTTSISLSAAHSIQNNVERLEVLSPYQYVKVLQANAFAFDGFQAQDQTKFFLQRWGDPELYRNVKGADYQDQIFQLADVDQYNLSIKGGTKDTNFYYSGEYLDQQGTIINTGFKKIINSLRLNHKINKKTSVNALLRYSFINRKGLNVNGNGFNSVIRDAIQFRPIEPLIEGPSEEEGLDLDDDAFRFLFNPVKNLLNTDRSRRQNVVRGNLILQHKFDKKWTFKTTGTYQIDKRNDYTFHGKDTYQGTRGGKRIHGNITNVEYKTLASSNVLTYRTNVKKHRFNVLGGFEALYKDFDYSWLENTYLPLDSNGIYGLGQGTIPSLPRIRASQTSLLSYFGRFDYDFNKKYLFTATYRADGSSKFNKDNRWGYFPAVNGGWKVSDENFLKKSNFINFMKLRAGWGIAGNNRIPDYAAQTQLQLDNNAGYTWGQDNTFLPGVFLSNFGVSNLRWESTSQSNFGLDLTFFRNKINTTIDVYDKRTKDLLLFANAAPSVGLSQIYQNVGKVQNRGLEVLVNTKNIDNPNFKWNSSFNISFNQNKTLALNAGGDDIRTDPGFYRELSENHYITKVGEPVGMIYGLNYHSIYDVEDFNYSQDNIYTLKDGIPNNGTTNVAPGSTRYVDHNVDGTIGVDDRVIIGNPHPKHLGGFTNDFRIGNFDAQVLFTWKYDFDILNLNNVAFGTPTGRAVNGFDELANSWSPFNSDAVLNGTRFFNTTNGSPNGNQIDDRFVEDGSYIRLASVSLGYNIPRGVLDRLNIKDIRVFLSGQNLHTWTDYSGYSPDVSVATKKFGALAPNLDYSSYPQSVTFQLGVDVKF